MGCLAMCSMFNKIFKLVPRSRTNIILLRQNYELCNEESKNAAFN